MSFFWPNDSLECLTPLKGTDLVFWPIGILNLRFGQNGPEQTIRIEVGFNRILEFLSPWDSNLCLKSPGSFVQTQLDLKDVVDTKFAMEIKQACLYGWAVVNWVQAVQFRKLAVETRRAQAIEIFLSLSKTKIWVFDKSI